MFYSHEILTSRQYGVATIWLVATVGKGTQRKLNKKAIQEVNVPKACEKIIDPGPPLALRLQSNLLYGVSQVFAQQCGYVLDDAERIQSDMLSYFRSMKQNEIDPQAGKTKRHNITLQDDPNFDIMNPLPRIDLLLGLSKDSERLFVSQSTTQNISQFTPLGSQQTASSGKPDSHFSINLPDSSHSEGTYRLPSDLGHYTPTMVKQSQGLEPAAESQPFADDENPFGGFNLDIDSNGNILGIIDNQAELPPLPDTVEHDAQVFQEQLLLAGDDAAHFAQPDGGSNVRILDEQPLPDAAAFPRTMDNQSSSSSLTPIATSETEKVVASAKRRRQRSKKTVNMLDQQDHVSRDEFCSWSTNYVANMDAQRDRGRVTSLARARKNAFALLYGSGIGNVGAAHVVSIDEIAHPLADQFSGNMLRSQLLGRDFEGMKSTGPSNRGRRRGRAEAFAED